jgi:hypothetical protein
VNIFLNQQNNVKNVDVLCPQRLEYLDKNAPLINGDGFLYDE